MKNNQKLQISAIVPVFNEEKAAGKVIGTLLKSNLIFEKILLKIHRKICQKDYSLKIPFTIQAQSEPKFCWLAIWDYVRTSLMFI